MKNIIGALADLLCQYIPLPVGGGGGVAFIVHMRHVDDVYRKFPMFRMFPKAVTLSIFRLLWPITVSRITGLKHVTSGDDIPGWIISVPLTARQMLEDRVLAKRRILQAVRLAERKGVRVVALGALTTSLTHGGTYIAERTKLVVTTGHAYTIHNVTQTVLRIMRSLERSTTEATLAIVGANGSIGSNCARVLAANGFKKIILIDIVRRSDGLDDLCKEVSLLAPETEVVLDHRVTAVKEADIIIAATNAPEALIKAEDLRMGAVVIDDAQPTDVDESVFERDDVLVLEAGAVRTPGIRANFNIDLKHREDNYACLAEAFILAATEMYDAKVLGRPSLQQIETFGKAGERLGFRTADFQNMYGVIDAEKLDKMRAKAR